MKDFTKDIKGYVEREIEALNSININAINSIMNVILEAYENSATIYIFGNGGSAATASHIQNDFNKGVSERLDKKFNFMCLNDNISTVLAVANDIGYEHIYAHQLKNRLKKDDVVIGISGSGNSPNILAAVEYAKTQNVMTIGISGYGGGSLAKMADISFFVDISCMQITEDIHMILGHMMTDVFSTL